MPVRKSSSGARFSRFGSTFFLACAIALSVAFPWGAQGQTIVFEEPFDNQSQFSVTQGAFGQDGGDNYFILAQNADPSIDKSYDGAGTNFLAGQDLDDDKVNSDPAQIEWTGIDVSGKSGLEFAGEFGAVLDGSGEMEESDFLRVQYQIDGNGYQTLLEFRGDQNGEFAEDTNLDGTGDGPSISSANGSLVNFTKSISGTGSTLDLRFTASVSAGDEDFAVDDFSITSSPAVQFTVGSGSVSENDGSTVLLVEILDPPSGTTVSADVVFNSGSSSASAGDVGSFGTKNVTFPAGVSDGATRSVTVTLATDDGEEGSETAVFNLENVSGGSVIAGSPSQFDLTIQDAVSDHAGDVLITELMPDPDAVGDGDGEYIELYNATSSDVDVGSWTIDVGGDTDGLSGVTIPARGFAVLCVNATGSENGGIQNCDLDYASGISLNQGGETVILRDGDGNRVDVVDYADTSPWPDPTGAALLFTGTTDNNDGSNWVEASRRERGFALNQSGDLGSPGRNGNQQTLQPTTDVTGGAGWRLLSAPMSAVTPNQLAQSNLVQGVSGHHPSSDANLYQWPGGVPENVSWSVPSSATTELTGSARGFIWYVFDAAQTAETDPPPFTLSLPGSPRTASVDATGLGEGFYLLGNPYAQSYDLSDLSLAANNFSTTVQVWDPSANTYKDVTQSAGAGDLIGPYQGFFVERATGTTDKTLTFSPDGRRADPVTLKNTTEGPTRIGFRLIGRVADSVLARDAALTLLGHPQATVGWDVYDASKLTPLSGRYATMAFEGPPGRTSAVRAVASVPSSLPREGVEVPIRLATRNAGSIDRYTLTWPTWERVPDDWMLVLRDRVADSTVHLHRHSAYTFEVETPAKYRVQNSRTSRNTKGLRTPTPLPKVLPAKSAPGPPRFVLRVTRGSIPVEFAGLRATVSEGAVELQWSTASETNNAGFYVEHRGSQSSSFHALGYVEGAGTTRRPQSYRYRTGPLDPGRHTFRLRQVDTDGSETYSDTVAVAVSLVRAAQITVAPTPVHQRTTVTLRVQTRQEVTVSLYDALGRRVRTLHRGPLTPNAPHTFRLEANQLASGLYLLRVSGEQFQKTRRVPIVQ